MQKVEIRVKGQIDRDWSDWFGGFTIKHTERGETVLAGSVRDQSALLGVLNRLSGLGLHLISVSPVGSDREYKKGVMPIEEDMISGAENKKKT